MKRALVILLCAVFVSKASGISFELNTNKIYLPVKINGKKTGSFILDTGAHFNVVDMERAKSLGLSTTGSTEVHGAGDGSLPSARAKDVDLSVDGAGLAKGEVEVMPINKEISFSEGRAVDGLLGRPFFERFVVEIDYANKKITFHEPAKFQYTGQGEAIPLETFGPGVGIRAKLLLPNGERVEAKLLVDTGWRGALSLNSPFVRERKMPATTNTIFATIGVGIGGPMQNAVGRISAVEIGRFVIKAPVTSFSDAPSGILADNQFTGILGADTLRRFTVVFDYPQKRMILQPNPSFDEVSEFDMSGLYLTAEGKDFKIFKVYKMIADSPAGAAGVREGDQIFSINDQPVSKLTLEQIRQMFRQPDKEYSLRMLRGDNMVQTKFTTRRLI
jgi:predicted aspartyl protease